MTLTITASNPGGEAASDDDPSVLTLAAALGTSVTFTLDGHDGAIASPVITRKEDDKPISVEFVQAAPMTTATATYVVEKHGTYVASATVGGTPEVSSNGVRLSEPAGLVSPATPPENRDDAPVELEIGELDRPFAFVTLGFAVVVTVGIAYALWSVISRVALPGAGTVVPTDGHLDGTFEHRAQAILLMLSTGVGAIVLTFGAWLAAMETRGRLRAPVRADDPSKGGGAGLGEAELKAAALVLEKITRMRGSIAVVTAGFVILLVSVLSMNGMAGAETSSGPVETSSTSPSPSGVPASEAPSTAATP